MPEAIVWTNPDRADFVGKIAHAAGLTLIGAGGPGRTGPAAAQRLETAPVEDLRTALTETQAKVILVADAGPFGTADTPSDAEAVLAASGRGVQVIALEAVPASVFASAGGTWTKARHGRRAIDAIRFVPGRADHPALASIDEVLASFGPVTVASVRVTCQPGQLGLDTVLLSALSMIDRVLGPVESIDATMTPNEPARTPIAAQGRLRDLNGHAVALLRSTQGTAGHVFASDSADAWERTIELLGPAGRLIIREEGFVWTDLGGAIVDSNHAAIEGEAAVTSLARAIRAHLDQPEPRGEELQGALTLAQAALLSQKTRQPESPAAIIRAAAL
ncbi:MAG: hypothetical protein AAF297_12195 [Planctomycetota bacterium]